MDIIAGSVVLLLISIAIIGFIVDSVKMVQKDARKEERENARHLASFWADQMYQARLRNTDFHVKQRVVFSNESDIKW